MWLTHFMRKYARLRFTALFSRVIFCLALVTFRRFPAWNLSASLYLPATCHSLSVLSLQTKRDLSRNLDRKKSFHLTFLRLCKCYRVHFFFLPLQKRSNASVKFSELPKWNLIFPWLGLSSPILFPFLCCLLQVLLFSPMGNWTAQGQRAATKTTAPCALRAWMAASTARTGRPRRGEDALRARAVECLRALQTIVILCHKRKQISEAHNLLLLKFVFFFL